MLVDIRRFPGSRKFPAYNKDNLKDSLINAHIGYMHIEQLGGRRRVRHDSVNQVWRNKSFQGYADYMETTEFHEAISLLEKIARVETTAFMCSEAVWWRCHRSMVSDYLKMKAWKVFHILSVTKIEEHPYTKPAKISNGHLFYN